MDIVLIPGLWLDAAAWDAVLPGLRAAGHNPVALTLPGQGDGAASATLDDQLDAVLAAVDAAGGPALVVGHSAASTLAWLAADRRPERVAAAVFVGGMPSADGEAFAPWFTATDARVPFPGWEPFAGPDSDDLSDEQKRSIEAGAHPVPEGVAQGLVRYQNPSRDALRAVEVCPEFSPQDVRDWIASGEAATLASMTDLELVDLESGHWPMFSQPDALAAILAQIASGRPRPDRRTA